MLELQQTARRLLRAPGFTLATVLTLALGIGAAIAIFTVVNGILIKPLPFPDSGTARVADASPPTTSRKCPRLHGDLLHLPR